jgi:hypothetical protein
MYHMYEKSKSCNLKVKNIFNKIIQENFTKLESDIHTGTGDI